MKKFAPVTLAVAALAVTVAPWVGAQSTAPTGVTSQSPEDPAVAGTAAPPPTAAAAQPTTGTVPTAQPARAAGPRVTEVLVVDGDRPVSRKRLTLEDRIAVRVTGLAAWLESNDRQCWDVRLVFDGQVVSGLGPERCDPAEGLVWFNLERLDRPAEPAWANLLQQREGLEAPVEISLAASADGPALPTDVGGGNVPMLLLAHAPRLVAVGILFTATLILFAYLSVRSDMLRDKGPKPAAPARRPYSLSRFQMGWWFVLALFAFLLISLLTGDAVPIPGTVLGLMGIAAGTHVGSEMIDSSRSGSAAGGGGADGGKSGGAGATATASGRPVASRGFITDIISDGQGVALHRFQNFIFTLALGGFFVVKVLTDLKMPEFDASLLGLMGISAGTYLGVKVPENGKGEGS